MDGGCSLQDLSPGNSGPETQCAVFKVQSFRVQSTCGGSAAEGAKKTSWTANVNRPFPNASGNVFLKIS